MRNADKVKEFFREICKIPHASYDESRMADYIISLAEKRGLENHRDKYGNVLIKKPSTFENCKAPPVIIQGHMDMVYLREDDCTLDYEDGIKLIERDGFLEADGTTLGADDGVALAYMLALLDSDEILHPDIELVFTVEEEVGLAGAANFDCSDIKGKYLINLDSEKEGIFVTSCAGAVRNEISLPTTRERIEDKQRLTVNLYGLLGGHSGLDVHLGRPNAINLMMRLVLSLGGTVNISSIDCDGKTNAIARDCTAVLYVEPEGLERARHRIEKAVKEFNDEFEGIDSIKLKIIAGEIETAMCWSKTCHRSTLGSLLMIPNGVVSWSSQIPGLVETSSNPGIVKQEDDRVIVSSCIRSSIGEDRKFIVDKLESAANICMGSSTCSNEYPQWEYREDSKLREFAMQSYRELFRKEAKDSAIHAGLECGFFAGRIPDIDIISFGPDQFDVHTTRERIDIYSLERVWQLLQKLLEKLCKYN